MFTGIISAVGPVMQTRQLNNGLKLTIKVPKDWDKLILGESISVNGACLTVAAINGQGFDAFLMPETLNKTSFGKNIPKTVNLERALSAADRLGGHFVQGHVDGLGSVIKIHKTKEYLIDIRFPKAYKQLVIYKGSIAIDGVSLTVATVKDDVLTVALIPHTLTHSTLGDLLIGDQVNLEFDMIGKYIVKSLELNSAKS